MSDKFYDKKGFIIKKIFNSKEINLLKKKILEKILDKDKTTKLKKINIKDLHQITNLNNTKKDIIKSDRRYIKLPKEILNKIQFNNTINSILKKNWGNNKYSVRIIRSKRKNEIKKNSCGFRIAEPNKKSIGIHCDATFFSKVLGQKINNKSLKSLWVPLEGFTKKYTLKVSPGSHLNVHPKNKFKKKGSYFFNKTYSNKFLYKRMDFKKGEAMLFHPNLLHGDSHNLGSNTRLSLEIRLYNSNELKNWKFI